MNAIIVVNYCTPQMTIDAVESVCGQLATKDRIFLIEGGSPDCSPEILTQRFANRSQVELTLLEVNGGFAYANNAAIRRILASEKYCEYVLLLNPDTVAQAGAVSALVSFLDQHPEVGIAGSRLENPDGSSQFAARRFHNIANEFDSALAFGPVTRLLRRWHISHSESDTPHVTDWLPGASLMIRREVFEKIGLLDEGYFMYFEEVDFCLRAKRAGFECWYVPQSRVTHFVGQSSGVTSAKPKRLPRYVHESRARYYLKNHGAPYKLACDLAWIIGRSIGLVRNWVQRRENPFPPHLWKDFVRFTLTSRNAWRLDKHA